MLAATMLRVVEDHLESTQVSRVIYGAIIGLAELYSEIVGTEVHTRQRVARARVGEIAAVAGAVAFGIGFPVLPALHGRRDGA